MSYIKPRTAITHTQLNSVADALEASVTDVEGSQVAHEGLDERAFSRDTAGFTCPWAAPTYKANLSGGFTPYVDQGVAWTTIPIGSTGSGVVTIPAGDFVTGDFLEIELQGIGSFIHYLNAHPITGGTRIPDYPDGLGGFEQEEFSYHKWHSRIAVEYSLDGGSTWNLFGPVGDAETDTPGAQWRCATLYRTSDIGAGFSGIGSTSNAIASLVWPIWPATPTTTTPTSNADIDNVNLGWYRTFYIHNLLPLVEGLLGTDIRIRARVRPGMYGSFASTAVADPVAIIQSCSLQVHIHRKGL